MSSKYTVGRNKEFKISGFPSDTFITKDNYGRILLTEKSYGLIAEVVEKILKRRLSLSELKDIEKFARQTSASNYYQLPYKQVIVKIANDFVRFTPVVDRTITSLTEYQRDELNQLTNDENQYKFTAFQDRRGNAFIDKNRVTPEKKPSSITDQDVKTATYKGMNVIQKLLSPESIDNMFNKINSTYTNFYNINLPHQTIRLDSRNRIINNNNMSNTYQWYIHQAGTAGQLGDIRIQDTLQQIIQMEICPFWIPIDNALNVYYQTVTMLIHEFRSQSINVTEFLDYDTPTEYQYHFEFEIGKKEIDRIQLIPRCPTFTFRMPFAMASTLTVSFRTPFETLVLEEDRGVYTITYGNPTLFTLTSGTNNNLSTGDLVYVINSSSGVASIDAEINRSMGFIITKINNTEFTIPVNTLALAPGTDTNVDVFYGSKRIFMQIEFTSLEH